MEIEIKKVYEDPSDKDGIRLLVDRLWPRGIKKENLQQNSENGLTTTLLDLTSLKKNHDVMPWALS